LLLAGVRIVTAVLSNRNDRIPMLSGCRTGRGPANKIGAAKLYDVCAATVPWRNLRRALPVKQQCHRFKVI
jgi:hypothetical protein